LHVYAYWCYKMLTLNAPSTVLYSAPPLRPPRAHSPRSTLSHPFRFPFASLPHSFPKIQPGSLDNLEASDLSLSPIFTRILVWIIPAAGDVCWHFTLTTRPNRPAQCSGSGLKVQVEINAYSLIPAKFSKLGRVQFLGLGYYCPSPEKKSERYTQFGAVCCPHQKLHKKLGVHPIFWGVWTPTPPVVAPMHNCVWRNTSVGWQRDMKDYSNKPRL